MLRNTLGDSTERICDLSFMTLVVRVQVVERILGRVVSLGCSAARIFVGDTDAGVESVIVRAPIRCGIVDKAGCTFSSGCDSTETPRNTVL